MVASSTLSSPARTAPSVTCESTLRQSPTMARSSALFRSPALLVRYSLLGRCGAGRGWTGRRFDRPFSPVLSRNPTTTTNDMDADQLFKLYEDTLHNILDSLVPVHQVVVRHGATTPWFDAECRAIKRHARMLERRYRRTRDPDDRLAWVNVLRAKHTSFKEKENRYWEATIKSNDKKPKVLWRTVSTILGKPSNQCHSAPSFTATDFLSFANQKVDTVRAATAGSRPPEFTHTECVLGSFEECSRQTVEKIIRNSASKSCDLDPAPTFLIKEFLGELLPFLTRMCNASIRQGHLPVSQKEAIVTPILKKSDLDPSDVKNYCPISNLPFMSKVVEKVVLGQLSVHLSVNDLFPKFQSGFRRGHSTESALLRVMSDIYAAIDTGKVSLLALLDVSAAFDTVGPFYPVGAPFQILRSHRLGPRVVRVIYIGSVDRPFDSGVPRHRLPWFVSVYPRAQSSAQSCTFSIRPMSPHLWNRLDSGSTSTPTTLSSTVSAHPTILPPWQTSSVER